ncbi:MAG: hypothetical protein JNL58_13550 [Planctomyces sp.]|nr:hypothetical protein [Planctomyces sp.]
MKISVHIDSSLPASAAELIDRKCQFAFGRFEPIIEDLRVSLTDENGPKGGNSIRCTVILQLLRRGEVIIHEQSDCHERAVALAVERASRQVARRNARRGRSTETVRRGELVGS